MIGLRYIHTVEILDVSRPSTFDGSESTSVRATIRGLMTPLEPREIFDGQRLRVVHDYKLFCDPTDITEADRARWDSKTFEVLGVKDTLHRGHHMLVRLRRIT